MKHTLLKQVATFGAVAAIVVACAWAQKKLGDQIAAFVGQGTAQYLECSEPAKVVKWFQKQCSAVGACTVPTGPISGAILKPIVDKLVPQGVDFVIPDEFGACVASRPKGGLKAFLYTLIDALPVELPN